MGNESLCRVEIGSDAAEAKALLETEELIVRGALRAKRSVLGKPYGRETGDPRRKAMTRQGRGFGTSITPRIE